MLDLWYKALQSPLGIEITVSDFDTVRSKLYALRREVKDSDLEKISLCRSPFDPEKLWMVKKV